MPPLRVGLIGCGNIAQLVHLPILSRQPNVQLVAIAEPDPHRRQEASKHAPAAAACVSYQELLAMPEVQAVVICVPNALHVEVAVAALEQGKPVYLEKPLAMNLDDGRRVLTAWRRSGVVGMIGFNYRVNALYQAVKARIQEGRIGTLVSVRSVFSTAAHPLPTWKQTRYDGGGVLLDLASHHVDLVHFFFEQEVCEVFARLRSQRNEGDSAVFQLRLADGLFVQSFFSLSSVEEDRFEVYGQAGKLAVDRYRSFDVEISEPQLQFVRFKWLTRKLRSISRVSYLFNKLLAPTNEPSYRTALTHFVTAVQNNQPASPDFWDGYRSLAVIVAAEESARTGRSVSLDFDRS